MIASLLLSLAVPALVSAHGYVNKVVIDGTTYEGNSVGTTATISSIIRQVDTNSPVQDVTSEDLNCGQGAQLAADVGNANPGSTVQIYWVGGTTGTTPWPHNEGPLMYYMASCSGSCATYNSSGAEWFKIAEQGYQSGTTWYQAALQTGSPATVTIPSNLASGNYLLRSEILSLQNAMSEGGAEFYPSCIQLTVGGSQTGTPSSSDEVTFPGGYSATDPGILVNVYNTPLNYVFPGPPVASFITGSNSSSGSSTGSGSGSSAPSASSPSVMPTAGSGSGSGSSTPPATSPSAMPTAGAGSGSGPSSAPTATSPVTPTSTPPSDSASTVPSSPSPTTSSEPEDPCGNPETETPTGASGPTSALPSPSVAPSSPSSGPGQPSAPGTAAGSPTVPSNPTTAPTAPSSPASPSTAPSPSSEPNDPCSEEPTTAPSAPTTAPTAPSAAMPSATPSSPSGSAVPTTSGAPSSPSSLPSSPVDIAVNQSSSAPSPTPTNGSGSGCMEEPSVAGSKRMHRRRRDRTVH